MGFIAGVQLNDDFKNIYLWKITETEDEFYEICHLDDLAISEYNKYRNTGRRKEKLAEKALLNSIFGEGVFLCHEKNGRPYLSMCNKEISISHTNEYVAAIVSDAGKVGIDIERIDRNFTAVESRALSKYESEYLSSENKSRQLAILWSAKEAIYKLMSEEGVDFAKQILIEKFDIDKDVRLKAVFISRNGSRTDLILRYMFIDGHIMVWTT